MTYTHRNGESEPPTVYNAWYWFYSDDDEQVFAEGVFYIDGEGWLCSTLHHRDDEEETYALDDLKGKWWGPVVLPWKQDA